MKYVLKNIAGLYLVLGSGFVATSVATASRLTADEAKCAQDCGSKFGLASIQESVPDKSFAVVYIRKGDLVNVSNGLVSVTFKAPNGTMNERNPSARRFATRSEANIHGARFHTRRARRTDPKGSGTAGHVGVIVIETNDPVNAAVNPATGLTNRL